MTNKKPKVTAEITISILDNGSYNLSNPDNLDLNTRIQALEELLTREKALREMMLKHDSDGNFLC